MFLGPSLCKETEFVRWYIHIAILKQIECGLYRAYSVVSSNIIFYPGWVYTYICTYTYIYIHIVYVYEDWKWSPQALLFACVGDLAMLGQSQGTPPPPTAAGSRKHLRPEKEARWTVQRSSLLRSVLSILPGKPSSPKYSATLPLK